jgi:Uma2 family endonuclease
MVEIQEKVLEFPKSFDEFVEWDYCDGFKYEWFENKVIKFEGMKMKHLFIYSVLTDCFVEKGYHNKGILISKPEIILSESQLRRPDIAYFTDEQAYQGREGIDIIPEFIIEVISGGDKMIDVENKLTEYFKAGAGGVPLKVVWHIIPAQEVVYVYTSRSDVKICFDKDICSAKPVLEDFEISVEDIFKDYNVRD